MGHGVRQGTALVLVVEGGQELVDGGVGASGRERHRVEAVVPAPQLVHPVLGHEHRLTGHETARRDRCRPQHVGGKGRSRGARVAPGRDVLEVVGEVSRAVGDDLGEGRGGGDRGLLRGHLTDLGFPACAVAAQHHRAGRGPEVLATLDGTGTAEHGDPVTASGLVAGEDQRVVARVREQEGTAEGSELAHRIRDPQPEPGPAQADGVPAGEGGLHGPLLRRPAEDRGIRGPRGVHQRAIALGLQCEHPVEAVAVRDKVNGVGRGVCSRRPVRG